MTREYTSWGRKDGLHANHWGVDLNLAKPTTGVVQSNGVEYLSDAMFGQGAIDLAWEEHRIECKGICADCHCNHSSENFHASGGTLTPGEWGGKCSCYRVTDHKYFPIEDDHDGCGPQETGTILIGSWKKGEDGKWEPDQTGEYSAIVGEIYTQVVWSKHVKHVRPCSPCFPAQGDLDSTAAPDEDGFLCFDLPPEMYGDNE